MMTSQEFPGGGCSSDPLWELGSVEGAEKSCDPIFRHGVVVGFNGSVSSQRALAYATGMAMRMDSGLIIVYVTNPFPAALWMGSDGPDFLVDRRTEALGLQLAGADYLAEVAWILVERDGYTYHELEDVGEEYLAEAIVVGSTPGLMGRVFGSVAGRLSRRARRPVIAVP